MFKLGNHSNLTIVYSTIKSKKYRIISLKYSFDLYTYSKILNQLLTINNYIKQQKLKLNVFQSSIP